ncbi:hypothetical protein NMG60_11001733 [Bertholletia excelsa]
MILLCWLQFSGLINVFQTLAETQESPQCLQEPTLNMSTRHKILDNLFQKWYMHEGQDFACGFGMQRNYHRN